MRAGGGIQGRLVVEGDLPRGAAGTADSVDLLAGVPDGSSIAAAAGAAGVRRSWAVGQDAAMRQQSRRRSTK